MSSHCTICQSESSSWQIIDAEFYLNLKDWERSYEVCFAKFIFLGLGFACLIQEFMSFSSNTNMAQRGQGRKLNFDQIFQGKIRKMINTWLLDIQETQVQRTAIWGRGRIFIAIFEAKKNTWLCWIAFVRRCFSLVGDKPSDIKYWVQRVFGQPSAKPHDRRDHLYILYNKKYEIYVDSNQYLANPWPIHMFIIVISKSLLHRLNLFLLLLNILKHGQKGRELAKLQLCYIQNQDIPEWIGI